jgi:hypothetical protein
VRFVIVAPDPRQSRRFQAEFPLIGLSEFGQPPLYGIGVQYRDCFGDLPHYDRFISLMPRLFSR